MNYNHVDNNCDYVKQPVSISYDSNSNKVKFEFEYDYKAAQGGGGNIVLSSPNISLPIKHKGVETKNASCVRTENKYICEFFTSKEIKL